MKERINFHALWCSKEMHGWLTGEYDKFCYKRLTREVQGIYKKIKSQLYNQGWE
jgi:hypothetical protein